MAGCTPAEFTGREVEVLAMVAPDRRASRSHSASTPRRRVPVLREAGIVPAALDAVVATRGRSATTSATST